MKHIKLFGVQHLLGMVLILATIGCTEQKKEFIDEQMLVVERQTSQLSRYVESYDYCHHVDFTIDVPLYGPKPLLDSLEVFLNKKLYGLFSWTVALDVFSEKEMYQDNLKGMLTHYTNKYKQYQDSIINDYSISLLVIAQTESFITYGLEFFHCGANCGSDLEFYTFSKKDGHLCRIIEQEDLSNYIKKNYPDDSRLIYEVPDSLSFGLLEDGILIAVPWASNHHYVAYRVKTQEVLPYLSEEAQELINSRGDSKYLFEKWSLGKQIGKVETIDGGSAVLMQRVSRWEYEDYGYDELTVEDCDDKELPEVTAYIIKNDRYVPEDIKVKPYVFIGKTKDYLIRVDIDIENDQARYSSWKHKDCAIDEPDLLIDDPRCGILGQGIQLDLGYSFENKGYTYEVWTDEYPEGPQLRVRQGTKLLLKQPIQVLFSNVDD